MSAAVTILEWNGTSGSQASTDKTSGTIRYKAGFRPGDTLWVETTMTGARESKSNANRGIVDFEDRAFNQRDETVLEMSRQWLFERTPR